MVWLCLLVLSVFIAIIHNNKTSLLGEVLAIVPFQLGLFFIIVTGLAFLFQLRLMLIDGAGIEVSWNEYFDDDVYKSIEYLDGHKQIALNLENASEFYQGKYLKQMENIETFSSVAEIEFFYPKSLLPYQQKINALTIQDPINNLYWVFSLDQMVYVAMSNQDTNDSEYNILLMDNQEKAQFTTVPMVINNNFGSQIITENTMYSYDSDFQQLNLRFNLKEGEQFISGFNYSHSTVHVVTTKNVYIFDSQKVKDISKILTPLTVIKLPSAHENLTSIKVAETMDTLLFEFLYGKLRTKGHFSAEQILIEVDSTTNQINTLAKRPLKNGFSEMYYHLNWYISPLTHWMSEYLLKPNLGPERLKPKSVRPDLYLSSALKIMIVILTLISVLCVLWFNKKRDVSKHAKLGWIVLTCLTSITGLLTYLLLTDKKIKINQE
jgi:hypothetical protein